MEKIGDSKGVAHNTVIDYLKAIAILFVIIMHSLSKQEQDNILFYYILRMAVPLFVLISGFNYSGSVSRMRRLKEWYFPKRIISKFRIYLCPMFCVFALYCLMEALLQYFSIRELVSAFLLQSYGKGAYYFWIIIQLYLIFPVIFYLCRRVRGGICA